MHKTHRIQRFLSKATHLRCKNQTFQSFLNHHWGIIIHQKNANPKSEHEQKQQLIIRT